MAQRGLIVPPPRYPESVSSPASVSPVWLTASRLFAILTLVVVCVSFGTAGVLIQEGRAEDVHGYAAIALHVATGGLTVGLAGMTYERRRHWWTVAVALALFVYTFVQAALGETTTIYLHIPGALFVAAATVWLTVWLFTGKATSG